MKAFIISLVVIAWIFCGLSTVTRIIKKDELIENSKKSRLIKYLAIILAGPISMISVKK